MSSMHYVGLDVHKKTIAYCVKDAQGRLIERGELAAKLAPRLAQVHQRELARGNKNRATLAVARRIVAYLLAVDRRGSDFVEREVNAAQVA